MSPAFSSSSAARAHGAAGSSLAALEQAVVSARSLLLAPSGDPGADPAGPGPAAPAHLAPDGPAAWPLPPALAPLVPGGGLRRGSTVRVEGSTSLLLALMAEASQAGAWCGAVGLGSLNPAAAAEAGVDLDRLALVPRPRETWPSVVAALLDAVDVVAVAPPPGSAGRSAVTSVARRLSTRARERRGVLLVVGGAGTWTSADVELTAVGSRWAGLGDGHGHLRERSLDVRASGRRVGGRPRTARLDLTPPGSPDEGILRCDRPHKGALHHDHVAGRRPARAVAP